MTYSGTLSSKGQITIPIEIRQRLGLREGDKVEFVTDGESTTIRPRRSEDDPFSEYVGMLAGKIPNKIQEIVREERIMRGRQRED